MSRVYEPQPEQQPDRAAVRVGRADMAPLAFLQSTAGNRAVTNLVVQRQAVGPKEQTKLPGKAGVFQAFIDEGPGPYGLIMYVLNDDVVGHAWLGVRRGDGQVRTIGFWPKWVTGGIASPGIEYSPDPHTGEQTGAHEQPIPDITQIYRVLSVIQEWESAIYTMVFSNCTHFVVEAWRTVTGTDATPGRLGDLAIDWWNPLMLGQVIDERNRNK